MSEELALSIAKSLASKLLELMTVDDAKALLDATAIERANLAADIAEQVKFRG